MEKEIVSDSDRAIDVVRAEFEAWRSQRVGLVDTPTVTYAYDNNQSSATKGMLLSIAAGTGYSESYTYSVGQGNGGNGVIESI